MTRVLFLSVALLVALLCPAQRQAGYVKTPGRLAADGKVIAGQRIAGATLYFRDISTVGSGADGTFTVAVPGKSFMLTRVQKNGYELADRDILGRSRSLSAEPFIVVVDKPDALLSEQLASERRLRRTLTDQLRAREDEIEALREQQRITEDEYHKKLQALYAAQENNEKLISDMAERYARMDFDQLDDFRRRVAACIQNGDLTRADSLLNTRGNLLDRAAALKRDEAALHAYADDLARRQEAHDKSVALRAQALKDFGIDCYNRAEICQLRHMNDSAAYYLELRANTDTLNAEWQNDAGRFIDYSVEDYDKARLYYNRILQIPSLDDRWKAIAYNNIGHIYTSVGKYEEALKFHDKALKIRLDIFDENHFDVANSYNNIGGIYDLQGEYSKAIEYLCKALEIRLKVFGENHPDVANSYNNLGTLYISLNQYARALEYIEKALKIQLDVFGEKHTEVAISYNNIGHIYGVLHKFEKALQYHNNALKIRLDIFGMSHSDVALSYNNLGFTYGALGEYDKALEYHNKALKTRINIFSEKHPEVANSYNNIGYIYSSRREYDKALEYHNKALTILQDVLGPNHPHLAISFQNIGSIYSSLGKYDKALEYNERALKIRLDVLGETNPSVANSYKNIAYIYWTAKSKGEKLPGFDEFTSERVFAGTIVPGDTPAAEQGLSGEYSVLEFGDWSIDSDSNLFDKNQELQGKSKTIVVMQDGKITQHHFENAIGMQLGYKKVGRAERQRIIDEYHQWKSHRQDMDTPLSL